MHTIAAQDLVDTVREGLLVLDARLAVVSANRSFYTMFRMEPEEAVGRELSGLGDRQWDAPALRVLLDEVLRKDQPVEAFEVDHVFPRVGRRIVQLNARKVDQPGNGTGHILVTFYDVTDARLERFRAERSLRAAQVIVDTVRDPLVILEADLTIATASRNFVALFGEADADVVGRRLGDLKQGQWDVAALRTLLERVVSDEAPFENFLVEDDFGELGHRVFKLNARKIFVPGNHVTQLLLAFEDVTEATLFDRHRDVLAAELAHRIKNSLQVISSFVAFEIRRAAEPCREGYKAMQGRIAAVAKLYDLIARSAAFGPVKAEAYLEGIAASIRSSLLGSEGSISLDVETEPLAILPDHAVPIGLMLNELATNAVKHAFPDGTGRIVLGFARRDGEVTLTVADNGVGIGTSAGQSVSGMGSRFVDAFVRQVGGTLARATGANGTTFTVRLPTSVLAGS